MKNFSLVLSLFAMVCSAQAYEASKISSDSCKAKAPGDAKWVQCQNTKRPKLGDVDTSSEAKRYFDAAVQYATADNGNLYAIVKKTNGYMACEVTNNVKSFKVTSNTNDRAMVYYTQAMNEGDKEIQGGHLDLVIVKPEVFQGDLGKCPSFKSAKQVLVHGIKGKENGYDVVNNKNSRIVSFSLSTDGQLVGYGAVGDFTKIVNENHVDDFEVSTCFGSQKTFSSYIAFAVQGNQILKIKGKKTGVIWDDVEITKADAKRDGDKYESAVDFMKRMHVCQEIKD